MLRYIINTIQEKRTFGLKIAEEAIVYAMHIGRKTVKARDIKISAREVMSR